MTEHHNHDSAAATANTSRQGGERERNEQVGRQIDRQTDIF
jgi:hypothetical protein